MLHTPCEKLESRGPQLQKRNRHRDTHLHQRMKRGRIPEIKPLVSQVLGHAPLCVPNVSFQQSGRYSRHAGHRLVGSSAACRVVPHALQIIWKTKPAIQIQWQTAACTQFFFVRYIVKECALSDHVGQKWLASRWRCRGLRK